MSLVDPSWHNGTAKSAPADDSIVLRRSTYCGPNFTVSLRELVQNAIADPYISDRVSARVLSPHQAIILGIFLPNAIPVKLSGDLSMLRHIN